MIENRDEFSIKIIAETVNYIAAFIVSPIILKADFIKMVVV